MDWFEKNDLREFRRLRNYYRRNFTNGESDDSFLNWCEMMCARESGINLGGGRCGPGAAATDGGAQGVTAAAQVNKYGVIVGAEEVVLARGDGGGNRRD